MAAFRVLLTVPVHHHIGAVGTPAVLVRRPKRKSMLRRAGAARFGRAMTGGC
jgi:hypothetical protein